MKRFSLILTIVLTICFVGSAYPQQTFKLGFVRIVNDDGDSVWLANTNDEERIVMRAAERFGYQDIGKINVNGRDINLNHTSGDLPDKNFEVGPGGYDVWKGNNIKVRLDYVFTRLCPPKD